MTTLPAKPQENDSIVFKEKLYQYKAELGRGGCGETVLLYDPEMEENFVCKKFSPFYDEGHQALFLNFLEEIKLLYQINHKNIVRIFTYHIYRDVQIGYYLMEEIKGMNIEEYLFYNPKDINNIFRQCIDGFMYLESTGVLHRDIRMDNIMVTNNKLVKIIDFGFGKKINSFTDFNKSISLNWGFEAPEDFNKNQYDFQTEVYFIGMLFRQIITKNSNNFFNFNSILNKMCEYNISQRFSSFNEVFKALNENKIDELSFSQDEKNIYREFVNSLISSITEVETDIKYLNDFTKIQNTLSDYYKNVMLEESLPSNEKLIEFFICGKFNYSSKIVIKVSILKSFINFFRRCNINKKRIILSNIHSNLDTIKREPSFHFIDDDEIPF